MRYTVAGVRPGAEAAFTPQLTQAGGRSTFWGMAGVVGNPGTMAIRAPKPGVAPSASGTRGNQPSYNSPDFILPSVYYVSGEASRHMHGPVRLKSDHPMPVPARNLYNMAGVSMRSRRVGGQNQVAQPGVLQLWPDLNARIRGSNA